jgi:hypothetical protein
MVETAAESTEHEHMHAQGWGGRRRGAGRRPRDVDKWIAARGLKPASAAEILERADERRIWYRLLHSDDDAIVLRTAMYLTDRRDGRPAQQINVTSLGVTITADEIAKARSVVAEITGHRAGLPATASAGLTPLLEAMNSPADRVHQDSPSCDHQTHGLAFKV